MASPGIGRKQLNQDVMITSQNRFIKTSYWPFCKSISDRGFNFTMTASSVVLSVFFYLCETNSADNCWLVYMKKFLSISFALLILLSGMHLTIATHYCGGQIAASKVSISGELASCGMEPLEIIPFQGKRFSTHCCDDKVSAFTVENNYSPSFFVVKTFPQQLLQVFLIPDSYTFDSLTSKYLICTNVSPPGDFQVSAVSLPDICVFRN